MPLLTEPLRTFGSALTANFAVASANPAQAEDQLKGPVQLLLHVAGEEFDLDIVARTEALGHPGVRPDIGVSTGQLLVGHVELKAPGKGVRPGTSWAEHDRQQFEKLRDHPNLLYTDGNDWALYRRGRLAATVKARGDVRSDGAHAFDDAAALQLESTLRDFFTWEPLVPTSPPALAQLLAPLTRLLRESVRLSLANPQSALKHLADDWRDFFFPDADDAQFADAYAQTLTYALLLARVEGERDLHGNAPARLDRRHSLLAQVLRLITDPLARAEVAVPVDLLERVIAAVNPAALAKKAKDRDIWLYFYEDFLAAYDKRLRKNRGVYFTPPAVVGAQVELVAELLRTRFDKEVGFASDDVVVLDPAVGTGTYLLAAMNEGLERVREKYGAGQVAGRAGVVGRSFHGFELLVASYVVSHLRFAQQIAEAGADLPENGAHIYLTDTLEAPHVAPPGFAHRPLFVEKLAQENERARRVKTDARVLVCIGNPPYFRQTIEPDEVGIVDRLGGWVRREADGEVGILRDFLRDTPGVHAKNLYNLYVYFWRWALWKVFEHSPGPGIVSFITASSYLRGPGFAGMRRHMRETFDDLWILDLGGEGRGARQDENVFDIQTPVAIAVGVRYGDPNPAQSARVRYARLEGTREEKYAALRNVDAFSRVTWAECFSGWTQPFVPQQTGDYFSWPALTDLFPWQHTGMEVKRTWPIAPDRQTLERRWIALLSSSVNERRELFRETRDRKIGHAYADLADNLSRLPPIETLAPDVPVPSSIRIAFRTLDRQFFLADNRLADYPRPVLWRSWGPRQTFLTTLLTDILGTGPAATASTLVPDRHHFSGRGGKDVIPLYRDAAAREPNVGGGLLRALGNVLPEELLAYCYAILTAPAYASRFAQELEIPGPRVPLTRNGELWKRAVGLGERLLFLHTYAERFVPPGAKAGEVPQGPARSVVAVPSTEDAYPARHWYDVEKHELHVGDGVFAPVSPEVRSYSVSGLDVLGSWLDYRMREGAGRRSSQLDRIRPTAWPAVFSEELLRLLWIVEGTVALGPELDALLDAVAAGPVFQAADLPQPTPESRLPPRGQADAASWS